MFALSRSAAPTAAFLLIAASAAAQRPTMDSLWPNEDGRSWIYTQHYENFESPQVLDNHTRIFLDGATEAPNGIQAQYLRQELVGGPGMASAFGAAGPDPLLQQLWLARPDLQQKIRRAVQDAPCPQDHPMGASSVLLNGEFAFRKTPDEIAAWRCDLADTRSWIWLVSNLTLGNSFTLQLVPDIADDVFLHGTITGSEDVVVPAGAFDGCLRVDYIVDYGHSECRDENGTLLATFRSETRGFVDYARDVGPVKSGEDFIPYVELVGNCGTPIGLGEVGARASMQLETPSTAVRRATWGRLKLTYR